MEKIDNDSFRCSASYKLGRSRRMRVLVCMVWVRFGHIGRSSCVLLSFLLLHGLTRISNDEKHMHERVYMVSSIYRV